MKKHKIKSIIVIMLKTIGPLAILVAATWIVMGMGISVIINWGGAAP